MKQLITLIILLCFITGLEAQDQKMAFRGTGISSSASILDHSVRGYVEPYVSWGTNKNQLILAPTILAASNIGIQTPQAPRLSGARIGYQVWPGTLDNKWAFYMSVDLRLQRLKDYWIGNSFNDQLSEYQEHNIKTVELLIENYLGYGLIFKINKSLSISQGIGLGWYLSKLHTGSSVTHAQVADLVDYRGYDDIGFIWNARFEINYKF